MTVDRIDPGDFASLHESDAEELLSCTHCGGDGECMDGADPLGNCPEEPHRCHACGGSGLIKDQVIF